MLLLIIQELTNLKNITEMKNILLYTLLLTATLGYGQGLLPEEKVKKSHQHNPCTKQRSTIGKVNIMKD